MNQKIEELRTALEENPQPRIYVQLAEELKLQDRADEAEEILTACVGLFPSYLSAKVALARLHHAAERYDDTLTLCLDILHSDPENLVAQRLTADTYYRKNDYLEAVKSYKRLRGISPGDPAVDALIDELEDKLSGSSQPGDSAAARLKAYLQKLQKRSS